MSEETCFPHGLFQKVGRSTHSGGLSTEGVSGLLISHLILEKVYKYQKIYIVTQN